MKDQTKISPEKEKPINFREMLAEAEKIDVSPNVVPSLTINNINQTNTPPTIPSLSLHLAPPIPNQGTLDRPTRPIGKSNSYSDTFGDQTLHQGNAKRQATNMITDQNPIDDDVFDPPSQKRQTLKANRLNKNQAQKLTGNTNKNANDIEKQLEREKTKEIKQASDRVYNNPENCNIKDIAITLNDINCRMAQEKQYRLQEKESFTEIVKSLLTASLNPVNESLRKISETQTEQEKKIQLNTDARIRFENVEQEVETMQITLDDCNTFVFENKTAIPEIRGDVSEINKRLDKIEANLANATNIGPPILGNQQVGNVMYTPEAWDEHLTMLNNEAKLNLMIFTRQLKAKTNLEAETIVKNINKEIERVSREEYGEDITIPRREVSRTMKSNALKVKCENLAEKFEYQNLINHRAKSMNVRADREIPGPYLSKFSQFTNIAYNIRKTKEYSVRVSIVENWMFLESRKNTDNPNEEYEWELVENNKYYPPLPGTKEHSEAVQKKFRNNSSTIRKETLSNTGDLAKLKKTIIVDTTPINIIPELTQEHKLAFLTHLDELVKSEHPGVVIESTHVWKTTTLEIQCKDIPNANKMASTIQGKPIGWQSSATGKVHLECSLLGWIKTRNRQNSFIQRKHTTT